MFADYTADQLEQVADKMIGSLPIFNPPGKGGQTKLTDCARQALKSRCEYIAAQPKGGGNGRAVETLLNQVHAARAKRCNLLSREGGTPDFFEIKGTPWCPVPGRGGDSVVIRPQVPSDEGILKKPDEGGGEDGFETETPDKTRRH